MKTLILLASAALGATTLLGQEYTSIAYGKLASGNAVANSMLQNAASTCPNALTAGGIPGEACDASNVQYLILSRNADGSFSYEVGFRWDAELTVNPAP